MRVSEKQEVSEQDVLDAVERQIREHLNEARMEFDLAMSAFQGAALDPSLMQDLWFRFNATERRLMKDTEGKEWSS
jgi:hypothetical protein